MAYVVRSMPFSMHLQCHLHGLQGGQAPVFVHIRLLLLVVDGNVTSDKHFCQWQIAMGNPTYHICIKVHTHDPASSCNGCSMIMARAVQWPIWRMCIAACGTEAYT